MILGYIRVSQISETTLNYS